MCVLSADLDQSGSGLCHRRGSGHLAIDVGPRATVGRNHTLENDLVVAAEEAPFDDARLDPRTDPLRIGLGAEQQGKGLDDHGLAGAGLARERAHPGPEIEPQFGDDAEILNCEFDQHRRSG